MESCHNAGDVLLFLTGRAWLEGARNGCVLLKFQLDYYWFDVADCQFPRHIHQQFPPIENVTVKRIHSCPSCITGNQKYFCLHDLRNKLLQNFCLQDEIFVHLKNFDNPLF